MIVLSLITIIISRNFESKVNIGIGWYEVGRWIDLFGFCIRIT